MFNDKVAQKPTMPVSDGKKNFQNSADESFDGVSKIGPKPLAADMAQNNKARAARGKKIALNTSNFLMLSTPRYTTNILISQKIKKQIAGPVSNPKDAG